MNRFVRRLIIVAVIFFVIGFLLKITGKYVGPDEEHRVAQNSILHINLEGIILNGKKFTKNLNKYKEEKDIKAIVVDINSPGGAVGPSQEIYSSILRIRKELKKPVVCVSSGLLASGAYYSAVACDKIVVAPGAMVGSIGVIMEFANLEKLYDWAKVSRYTITSGKYKDSGSEYRSMREDERRLFQDMINEVYGQFRSAVKEGRKLNDEVLDFYADGRVFTGEKAVALGFADKSGYLEDGFKLAADLAGLGTQYEIFKVPKKKFSIWDLAGAGAGAEEEDEEVSTSLGPLKGLLQSVGVEGVAERWGFETFRTLLGNKFKKQPRLRLPGNW